MKEHETAVLQKNGIESQNSSMEVKTKIILALLYHGGGITVMPYLSF